MEMQERGFGQEVLLTGRSQRSDQTCPSSVCTLRQTFHSSTLWRRPSTGPHDLQGGTHTQWTGGWLAFHLWQTGLWESSVDRLCMKMVCWGIIFIFNLRIMSMSNKDETPNREIVHVCVHMQEWNAWYNKKINKMKVKVWIPHRECCLNICT